MTTQSPNPSPDPQADDAVGHETGYESGTVVIHPHQAQQTKAQAPFWLKASRTLGWSVVLMGTATASALLGAAAILTVPLPTSWLPQQQESLSLRDLWESGFRYRVARPVTVLVMGIDEVPDVPESSEAIFSGRTDTMLLVRLDPASGEVNVMSIPRDTRMEIPGHGVMKVNQANVEGGAQLSAQTVSRNLDGIEIDRYVRVSTAAFREIVDLVGGVEVLVPKAMYYEDQTQDLLIDLEPGLQTLNGDQAEQFARFRQDAYGDIGRVQRQQTLLKALRDRLTSPGVVPRLPQIVRVLQRRIDTNLSAEELLALANFSLELETQDFHMVMLPGRFSEPGEYIASYWIMDSDASDRVVNNFFREDAVALLSGNIVAVRNLRVTVQNASADPWVARQVIQYLREQGFNQVYIDQDWPDTLDTTEIIAQRGDLTAAQAVESILGTGHVVSDSTGNLESDITIRVGQDWVSPGELPQIQTR
ncbi:MAG: LCP family protein [Cyanobacteria bacterium J06635_15]